MLSFDLFNRCLSDFSRRNDLPTVWTEGWLVWQKTITLYGKQVRHTPLMMTPKDYKFRYLQKLVIAACEPARDIVEVNPSQADFGFKWQFSLNDGYTFCLSHTSNLAMPPPGCKTLGVRSKLKQL